ncbi:DUF397 domain-containing protein [Streptomyces mirabilis]|uniref:DUF397 domain-containing protein n=1 Tax=Streptomyces mirabilis TaxID=68239 RepID=UPI00367DC291
MRATSDLSIPQSHKSTYSNDQPGGECVEVASVAIGLVRDSKAPLAPALAFTPDVWGAFVAALKDGTTPAV